MCIRVCLVVFVVYTRMYIYIGWREMLCIVNIWTTENVFRREYIFTHDDARRLLLPAPESALQKEACLPAAWQERCCAPFPSCGGGT